MTDQISYSLIYEEGIKIAFFAIILIWLLKSLYISIVILEHEKSDSNIFKSLLKAFLYGILWPILTLCVILSDFYKKVMKSSQK